MGEYLAYSLSDEFSGSLSMLFWWSLQSSMGEWVTTGTDRLEHRC